jgi:hypothetical protein
MNNLPSKELLSAVLGVEVISVREIHLNRTLLYETYKLERINIHELSHMVKEWAKNNGYSISSCLPIVTDEEGNPVFNYWYMAYVQNIETVDNMMPSKDFIGRTEPEAIFKAGEWILKEINNG